MGGQTIVGIQNIQFENTSQNIISSASGGEAGLKFNVATGQALIFDPGANESMRVDENDVIIDATTKIKNGKVIKAESTVECGFQVTNATVSTGKGTRGVIQIPGTT